MGDRQPLLINSSPRACARAPSTACLLIKDGQLYVESGVWRYGDWLTAKGPSEEDGPERPDDRFVLLRTKDVTTSGLSRMIRCRKLRGEGRGRERGGCCGLKPGWRGWTCRSRIEV